MSSDEEANGSKNTSPVQSPNVSKEKRKKKAPISKAPNGRPRKRQKFAGHDENEQEFAGTREDLADEYDEDEIIAPPRPSTRPKPKPLDHPSDQGPAARSTDFDASRAEFYRILRQLEKPYASDKKSEHALSPPKLLELLETLEALWCPQDLTDASLIEMVRLNLDIKPSDVGADGIVDPSLIDHRGATKAEIITVSLMARFAFANLLASDDYCKTHELHKRFNALIDIQYHSIRAYYSIMRLKSRIRYPERDLAPAEHIGILRFIPRNQIEDMNSFGKLVLAVLESLNAKQFRKFEGDVYTPVFTKEGHFTNYWERHMSIDEYVAGFVKVDHDLELFKCIASGRDIGPGVASFIKWFKSDYFPEVKPDRYFMAYRNGVYCVGEDKFYPYVDPKTGKTPEKVLSVDVSCCAYHDLEFNMYEGIQPTAIDTPIFLSILKKQKLPPEVILWVFILFGRTLYWGGELDNWQVCLLILGFSGTGKSTLLKFLRSIYRLEHVGILSNNTEKQWALSSIYNKFLVLGYEVKHNFAWEQAEFQSCVANEEVSVMIKHQTAFAHLWNVPIVLAGNEMIKKWKDASGSLARRLVILFFDQIVEQFERNPELIKQMTEKELPALIVKMNRLYRCAALHKDLKGKDLWTMLPGYFKNVSDEMMQQSNPLQQFLAQKEMFVWGGDTYCLFQDFKEAFKQWWRGHNMDNGKRGSNLNWDRDEFQSIFAQLGIKGPRLCEKKDYGGKMVNDRWLEGIDLNVEKFEFLTKRKVEAARNTAPAQPQDT